MVQQGQTFELTRRGPDGERLWAYRYRTGGRDSKRVQRGGFASEPDARDALERELERLRRERRISRRLTLSELVETYLAQHDVQPVTIEKLRYLLSKATAVFGDRRIGELTSQEIAEWRWGIYPGSRFPATQALRPDARAPKKHDKEGVEGWHPRRLLRWPPLERAEVMDVDVAAPLTGEQQRRAVAVLDPVERVERPRLQRHRSHARFGLRELQLTPSEGTAHVDDAFLAVDVALLESDPLRRP